MHTAPLRRALATVTTMLTATIAATAATTALGTTSAHAVVDEPPRPAFYETPTSLPSANGALIRSEAMT